MPRLLLVGVTSLVYFVTAATAAENLGTALMASSCNACHGPDGRSDAGIPPLAGRPADVLYGRLTGFRSEAFVGHVMNRHTKGYSEAELRAIAEYFSQQSPVRDSK